MCGIVGYSGFTKKISLLDAINAIKHRGPDSNGVQYFEGVALGNTRLAIIDLTKRGHQPMFNQDKSLCIVFNGEIYNFLEIKKLLKNQFHFRSNSDTEVILYAYQKWGVKCLEKLEGMFSFVIYDIKKQLLFGARDRLGQKPLKYFYDNGKFIFASEIKAILPLIDTKPELDPIAIDNFLTLQYVPSPATGFKKIYKLPAGHYFILKNKKLSIQRYWSLDFSKKRNLSDKDWQELVFNEIKRAVKSHLISDVPVGALLSGGLDSSILVALMSQTSSKINTFNIAFDDDQFDESPYARKVSKLYKTNHTQLNITANDLIKSLKQITEIFDEPLADNSILPTLLVSHLASKKLKVALTGDGGDENFAGYERYSYLILSEYLSKLPSLAKDFMSISGQLTYFTYPSKTTERMNRFLSTLSQPFYSKYQNYNLFFNHITKHSLYSQDFNKAIGNNNTFKLYRNFFDKKLDSLDNALKIDINTYLPDDLLYKSDSSSMAYGLELRAPFLDHILMEKVALMPSSKKLRFMNKKKILKEIAINYNLLPKEIVNRPKHGFTIPQNKWFKNSLKEYIYTTILSSAMVNIIFDKNKIKNYLDDYYNSNINYDNNIFALLTLSSWYDKYFG